MDRLSELFVQTNKDTRYGESHPIGYLIVEGKCWEWLGSKGRGYGHLSKGRRQVQAHRWVYEQKFGFIAEGKECHHICANRGCVNPDHIIIVTRKEHIAQDRKMGYAAYRRNKTRCPRGHPYSGTNLCIDSRGKRLCRECKQRTNRRWYARRVRGVI